MDLTLDVLTDRWTATEQMSIERSLKTIASTVRETAPFMRDMGLSSMLPVNDSIVARNAYITDMISEISEWEDRAVVDEASFVDENTIKVVVNNG